MRHSVNYRGYEINQSILDRQWYADPIKAKASAGNQARTADELCNDSATCTSNTDATDVQ